jgi:hypothetical protein
LQVAACLRKLSVCPIQSSASRLPVGGSLCTRPKKARMGQHGERNEFMFWTGDDYGLIETYGKKVDFTDKAAIEPLDYMLSIIKRYEISDEANKKHVWILKTLVFRIQTCYN